MKSFWWFVVALAFCLLTLVFVIVLMSREAISPNAMDNVSFASSIVSIVLAVISIFFSMNASVQTDRNLESMMQLDSKMNESINRLDGIRVVTEDTKKRINDYFEKANKVDVVQKEEKEKQLSASFFTYGLKTTDKDDKHLSSQDIIRLALEKVSKKFDCEIKYDYKLRGIPNLIFDGFSDIHGQPYIFEVKLLNDTKQAVDNFSRYLAVVSTALRRAGVFANVVAIAVSRNNDKDRMLEALNQKLFFPNLNLSVLAFDVDELTGGGTNKQE